jgi:hypothetical protein
MRTSIAFEPGEFYSLSDGHAIVFDKAPAGTVFERGSEYSLNSMFSMWDLTLAGKHAGFFFYTALKVENRSGFLVTFMESKRGKAQEGRLVIRHPEVMVYDFPGCGAMAISTKVSDHMYSILMEQ